MASIFEDNIRAATNAANNPNTIVNNTSTVRGITSTGGSPSTFPGVQAITQVPGSILNPNIPTQSPSLPGSSSSAGPSGSPPFPNVLNEYTSYNYSFTLSVLSPSQINTSSYKSGDFGPLILRSASGAPDKDLVETAYGKYDFYMDNLKIDGIIGYDRHSGNTNATNISFTVFEPYSMGLFFQSVQAAALKAGYRNYLDVPILLTIEFKGHIINNEKQEMFVTIPDTKKFIPMKIRNIGMKVTGKGSTYDIEAYPWNEQTFASQFNVTKSDITIRCDTGKYTVENILSLGEQSLEKVVNDYFKERVKKKDIEIPNEISIIFPPPVGNMPNKIGKSPLGFNEIAKGDTVYPKDNVVYDSAKGIYVRGNITIDVKNSDFRFNQSSSIVDMINQVVLMSDYARNALSEAEKNPQGQITWWRVESQLFIKPQGESNKTGQTHKQAVFRVVPFLVDSQYLLPVNTQRAGTNALKKESLKEYNYIYTGKNTEILDWNIDFRTAFYTALSADSVKNTENKDLNAATSPGADLNDLDRLKRDAVTRSIYGTTANGPTPHSLKNEVTETRTAKQGGGGVPDERTVAARQFHDILNSQFDQMNLSLTILGDPYFMTSSGYGNYKAAPTPYQNLNSDKSMNYENGQVVITVNFRTPIDINMETGFYNFGDTKPLLQFSGLYILTKVVHEFSRGKFKQTLEGFRIKGQDNLNAPVKEFNLNSESVSDSAGGGAGGGGSSGPAGIVPSLPGIVSTTTSGVFGNPNNTNNVNPSPPNPSLPGVINQGGFTI